MKSALDRRAPLALLAAHDIIRRYPLDPECIYVAAFSGGPCVALHLVLGTPDLFRGAVLNAADQPVDNADLLLLPRRLALRFQSATRLV